MNGVGVFVTMYSKIFMGTNAAGEQIYDYSSGFLYTTLLGALGCLACFYFSAQKRKGAIIEYGRLELENEKSAA